MGLFKDSLKKWFYTNNTSAASNNARVPLLNADGTPKGSDTMANLASVLGVMKWQGNIMGVNTPVDTGISVNAGNYGETLLALCSGHSGTGDSTTSAIYMLRLGYNGNNLHTSEIVKGTGSPSPGNYFTFGVSSNGTLTVAGPHSSNYVRLISSKT